MWRKRTVSAGDLCADRRRFPVAGGIFGRWGLAVLFLGILGWEICAAPGDRGRLRARGNSNGEGALTRLEGRLPEVALANGKSTAQMRAIFRRDPRLWVSQDGTLDYVCDHDHEAELMLLQAEESAGLEAETEVVEESIPLNQTFLLHSRPTATKVIYLDFDGHVTSGLHWNTSYNDGEDIVTPAYDTDGDESSFSNTELSNIQEIWLRVAEDYAPFHVDVTTEDPGVEALKNSGGGDQHYGIRVCIGGRSSDWYGSAGGVASLNSFSRSTDTPCFVFPKNLGNGNKKYVADAVSHEVGHTFGMHHDGQSGGSSYYTGHGDWAPIMGVGYYEPIGQWSRGEYPDANNSEDDLAMIASYVGYRADDHGDSQGTATALVGISLAGSGVVEETDDVDVFAFDTGAGSISITVDGAPPSPNLNVQLVLKNSSGTTVASGNPAGQMEAELAATVAAGTYYLFVQGVGEGDLATGYPDYGSLGAYTLTGTVQPSGSAPQPPSAPVGFRVVTSP